MRLKHLVESNSRNNGRVIARFGTAALLRCRRGWRLEGGTRSERIEAREWISLFMHEAVVGDDRRNA